MRNFLISLLLTRAMATAIISMDDAARKCHGVGPRDAGREPWLSLVGIAVKSLKDVE
jgi:hypothetical protein